MLKTIGWRLIGVVGTIYGALYLYERLTWTNRAREREFKRQYVAHATKKLKLIVDLTSANCSHQVQQYVEFILSNIEMSLFIESILTLFLYDCRELSSTFARLCHLVDETTSEMDTELKHIASTIRIVEDATSSAKVLRNKANYLTNELDLFDTAYLKSLN